jgi:hypothetical protein
MDFVVSELALDGNTEGERDGRLLLPVSAGNRLARRPLEFRGVRNPAPARQVVAGLSVG